MNAEPITPLRPTDRRITADLVPVPAGKGCTLYLTPVEYANAIARGKRIRRRELFRQRNQQNAQSHKVAPTVSLTSTSDTNTQRDRMELNAPPSAPR